MRHSGSRVFRSSSFLLIIAFMLQLLFLQPAVYGQKKASSNGQNREYVAIRVYHTSTNEQVASIEQYLQSSLLPLLEKSGIRKTGVFKSIDNDTAANKRLYMLIPLSSLAQIEQLTAITERSQLDSVNAKAYTKAAHNAPVFRRMETILLHAFTGMPQVKASGAKGDLNERIYELRSYESATEAQHLNKVQMFNKGEVELFERLGFNAVFYGQVIAGCRMPNLMYMTSFENRAARDEHWKAFSSDPEWKRLSGLPLYRNNVAKIDIVFMRATPYSKL